MRSNFQFESKVLIHSIEITFWLHLLSLFSFLFMFENSENRKWKRIQNVTINLKSFFIHYKILLFLNLIHFHVSYDGRSCLIAVENKGGVDAMAALRINLKSDTTLIDATVNESNCNRMWFVIQMFNSGNNFDTLTLDKVNKAEKGNC